MQEPSLFLEKPLPSNIPTEKLLIGTLILDSQSLTTIANNVEPDYFYSPLLRAIYQSILNLFNKGMELSPIYIQEDLKVRGFDVSMQAILETTYGLPILSDSDLVKYCLLIREKWCLRRIVKICSQVANNAVAEDTQSIEVINDASQALSVISRINEPINVLSIDRLVTESIQRTVKLSEGKTTILGIATGIFELDAKLLGLQKTNLVILGARPALGKTSLALCIASHASIVNENRVLVFSLEMSANELVDRMLCQLSEIDSQNYRIGNLHQTDWDKLSKAQVNLANAPLIIDDSPYVNTQYIRTKIREEMLKHQIDLVIVDYLQLMGGNSKYDSRYAEITQISREMKLLAKEFNIPLLVLSQLNRMSEARKDKRPALHDLRESGAIEQDADTVIFIHEEEGFHELIIAKHRNGPTGIIPVNFQKRYSKFSDVEQNF